MANLPTHGYGLVTMPFIGCMVCRFESDRGHHDYGDIPAELKTADPSNRDGTSSLQLLRQ